MLISTVRHNAKRVIGFCADMARLNVAITRAKKALWLIGCSETLAGGSPGLWGELFKNYADNNNVIDL